MHGLGLLGVVSQHPRLYKCLKPGFFLRGAGGSLPCSDPNSEETETETLLGPSRKSLTLRAGVSDLRLQVLGLVGLEFGV